MLTLYSMPGACSLADHIALVWSGLDYQVTWVTPAVIGSAEFLAKSPQGQVPILERGNFILAQNVAILSYIAESAPQAHIGADKTRESRADFLRWLTYIASDYHKAFSNIFGADHMGLSETAAAELKAVSVMALRTNHLGPMDTLLANQSYLFENRKTVVDAYFWVVTSWAYGFVPDLANAFPHLHAYSERLKKESGVQRALQEQSADQSV